MKAEGNIGYIKNGSYVSYSNVDFGSGVKSIELSVSSATKGGEIELRQGGVDDALLATITVERTGAWQNWQTVSAQLDPATSAKLKGKQNITLVFKGKIKGYLFNISWFQFS